MTAQTCEHASSSERLHYWQSNHLHIRPSACNLLSLSSFLEEGARSNETSDRRIISGLQRLPTYSSYFASPLDPDSSCQEDQLGATYLQSARESPSRTHSLRQAQLGHQIPKFQIGFRARGPVARTNETQSSTTLHKQTDNAADEIPHGQNLPIICEVSRSNRGTAANLDNPNRLG